MSSTKVHFQLLKQINDPNFISELQSASKKLLVKEGPQFFDIVIPYLKSDTNLEIKKTILQSLNDILKLKKHTKSFIAGKYLQNLPYDEIELDSFILDVLLTLTINAPDAFTSASVNAMCPLIERQPFKFCVLISAFITKFEEIRNPWPFVDILLTKSTMHFFTGPTSVKEFIQLIVHLCEISLPYRNERQRNCWSSICPLLNQYEDISVLKFCYRGLSILSKNYEEGSLPMDAVFKHINIEDLQDNILELLLLKIPPITEASENQFIKKLLSIARTNLKATIVLIRMADKIERSAILLNDTAWLKQPMPTYIDTLRIFFMILQHEQLHSLIIQKHELPFFLTKLATENHKKVVSYIAIVLQKLHMIDTKYLLKLRKAHLFETINHIIKKAANDEAYSQLFDLYLVISKIGYVPEMVEVCDIIALVVNNEGELVDKATTLAENLSVYSECIDALRKNGFDVVEEEDT